MSGKHRLFGHGELRRLASNLWIVRGGMPFTLYRNMVVYRLDDGRLLLHGLVALSDAGMKELEAIGLPSILIVPHRYDAMDARWYAERYPQAAFLTPDEERPEVEALGMKIADDPGRTLPPMGFKPHKVAGLKFTEYVLEAPIDEGSALICTSIFANTGAAPSNLAGRLVARLMMSGGRLAPGRMLRTLMVRDRNAFKTFLAGLSAIPNVRIVTVAHGDPIVDGDIPSQLKAAAA